jgi:hypothetical protein
MEYITRSSLWILLNEVGTFIKKYGDRPVTSLELMEIIRKAIEEEERCGE